MYLRFNKLIRSFFIPIYFAFSQMNGNGYKHTTSSVQYSCVSETDDDDDHDYAIRRQALLNENETTNGELPYVNTFWHRLNHGMKKLTENIYFTLHLNDTLFFPFFFRFSFLIFTFIHSLFISVHGAHRAAGWLSIESISFVLCDCMTVCILWNASDVSFCVIFVIVAVALALSFVEIKPTKTRNITV